MRRKPRKIRGFRRKSKTRTETLNIVRLLVVLRHLAHLAPTWGSASGRHGAIWGPFGAIPKLFYGLSGPVWSRFGPFGDPLWASGTRRKPRKIRGFLQKTDARIETCLTVPSYGRVGPSGGHPGAPWGRLGTSWARPGPSWGPKAPSWNPSWALLGPTWGRLGALLGPFWAVLGPSWNSLENAETRFSPKCRKPRKIRGFLCIARSDRRPPEQKTSYFTRFFEQRET